ncbi:WD40-repeat-containing domain protein [Stachybotrys elegans]|uniref:WD40-repeat-containing domain protein n=1 Tax=Stachybotrys elegans TaxID=80388 RepID=A0A8K0WPP4_9HYPO|nr:WD40-repeat-containing domain protein [Stachybotrys elegans]
MYTLSNIGTHTVSGTYALDVHRTAAGIASISSDQSLSLLDPSRLRAGPFVRLLTGHGNVSSLRVYDWGSSVVCTAGENGSVGVWDLRAGSKVAQFAASQKPILSLACNSATNTIAVGTELQDHTASVLLWDVRSTPTSRAQYDEVHSDDVTSLTFHPSEPAYLMSGSTDGLVNVYDTRIADEDEVILQTFNHNASIHHAAFLTDTHVLALSHDEQCALYDMADDNPSGDAAQHFGDLRQGLGCQYVANVSPKADGTGVILGAGAQENSQQGFELVFLTKGESAWAFDRSSSVGLPGAHGEEIVRAFCFIDEDQVVITAGEDGSVKAWRPSS